jgi:Helix-turn-helix domain
MSIDAVTAVLETSRAKGSARMVLVSLAWHANTDWEAWPSQATLAKHAGINRRNTRKALAALLALGES